MIPDLTPLEHGILSCVLDLNICADVLACLSLKLLGVLQNGEFQCEREQLGELEKEIELVGSLNPRPVI